MNVIIKKIKIAILKRQTIVFYGRVKRYSKQIDTWTKCYDVINDAQGIFIQRRINELKGNIKYYSKMVEGWKRGFESRKAELESLGVTVDLVL